MRDQDGSDGERYTKLTLAAGVLLPAGTVLSSLRLEKPTALASLWKRADFGDDVFGTAARFTGTASGGVFGGGTVISFRVHYAHLESLNSAVRAGAPGVFEFRGELAARQISATHVYDRTIAAASSSTIDGGAAGKFTVKIPEVTTTVTEVWLDRALPGWPVSAAGDIAIHFGFVTAGEITTEALTGVRPGDPLRVQTPFEIPADAELPAEFQLEDRNGRGAELAATLDSVSGVLTPGQSTRWPWPLVPPVRVFGNDWSRLRAERRSPWSFSGSATRRFRARVSRFRKNR